MMHRAKTHRGRVGFTLIELLIVVAIIAILAAIAVPNFLEAQIRSKVSRVKSDLRTVGMGIEMYQVDYNGPPPCTGYGSDNFRNYCMWVEFGDPNKTGGQFRRLTTPIAYLSTISVDVFAPIKAWGLPDLLWMSFGYAYYGKDHLMQAEPNSHVTQIYGPIKYRWILQSGGPDRWYNWGPDHGDPNGWQPEKGGLRGIYDPTNGVVSAGDMYYFETIGLVGGGGT